MTGPQKVVVCVLLAAALVLAAVKILGWETYNEISQYIVIPVILLIITVRELTNIWRGD